MGGGKIELHISSLHSLCKFRCKIIKKYARTQRARAQIYVLSKKTGVFYELLHF